MTKILLIEDEDSIRYNILELLEIEEFEAKAAENGRKGVELAKEIKPDLIICDVMMPELDGYGVLKELRSDPSTATIPFIFLTALADKTDTRKGMELGADDYLTKPCTPTELLNAIATRLEKQANIELQNSAKLEELRKNITLSLPHELRTPLNGIMGFADILLDELDSLETSEVREMIEHIKTSSHRLYRLIQNFLLYAELELISSNRDRINALRSHRTESPLPSSIVTEEATLQAKQVQRERDLTLQLEEGGVCMATTRFRKIVEELTNNAFKFSAPGTPVVVSSEVKDRSFILVVSDRGRGMSPEQIADLGAYMQFERKLYEQQGSGLGLAIVKHLAELHGGQFAIESLYNQQTTVKVILPAIL